MDLFSFFFNVILSNSGVKLRQVSKKVEIIFVGSARHAFNVLSNRMLEYFICEAPFHAQQVIEDRVTFSTVLLTLHSREIRWATESFSGREKDGEALGPKIF